MPSDDTTENNDSPERVSRQFNHRDYISERRQNILQQKQTDSLPRISQPANPAKIAWRQFIQLREENKRLRWEIAQLDQEKNAQQHIHEQQIAGYEQDLSRLGNELNQAHKAQMDLERRYQSLYSTFQSEVAEEASRIVSHTTRTLELQPGERPALTNDAMKTVELHVRQLEDKHTAQALYLMRQAQRKATQLEQELAQERQQIALERQSIIELQNSAKEKTLLRQRVMEDHLRGKYALTLSLTSALLLLILPALQMIALSLFHFQLTQWLLFCLAAPILICMLLAALFAYVTSSARLLFSAAPPKKSQKGSK